MTGHRGSASWAATVLLLVAVLGVGLAVQQVVGELTAPGTAVPVRAVAGMPAVDVPPGATLTPDVDAGSELRVADAPPWLELLALAEPVVFGLSVLAWALLLRRVLWSVAAGRPFDPHNPRRLRLVALAVLVGGPGGSLLSFLAAAALLDHVGIAWAAPGAPIGAPWAVRLSGLLWVVLALAAAEAFRQGSRLADDVAGLV